ncbi:MAG: hypothetical protein ACLQUZ_18205 [Rhizomicrobium sp.]
MSETSQKRALKDYRKRLDQRGMARFEVLGLKSDRNLIRSLAKRLAENDEAAARLRENVKQGVETSPGRRGGVLAALLRSPLVGSNLDLTRDVTYGRKVDL